MATTTVAKSNAPNAPAERVLPNQSLYIQNLPEKLPKHDLQRSLYMLFSTYGPVLDITAVKSTKMRGQAHVLFRDIHAASQAMRACQGFDFFGRQMKISYAKNKSLTLQKMTGQYDPPLQPGKPEEKAQPADTHPAPPGLEAQAKAPAPPGLPAPPGMPVGNPPPGPAAPVVPPPTLAPPPGPAENAPSPQGVKRAREEDDDGEEEEEDDDDEGSEMSMSDDD